MLSALQNLVMQRIKRPSYRLEIVTEIKKKTHTNVNITKQFSKFSCPRVYARVKRFS